MRYKILSPKNTDFKFSYLELGDENNQTLFCLGGANTEPIFYDIFYEKLSKKYHIVALSYPGIGNSFALNSELTMKTYRKYVDVFYKNFFKPNEKIIAIGISFGGLTLSEYIHYYKPSNIIGFIGLSMMSKLHTGSVFSLSLRYIKNEFRKYQRLKYESYTASLLSLRNYNHLREKSLHTNLVVKQRLDRNEIDWANQIPTLIINGLQDNIVDTRYTHWLFGGKEKTHVILVTDGSHDAFANMGDKIFNYIDEFLVERILKK